MKSKFFFFMFCFAFLLAGEFCISLAIAKEHSNGKATESLTPTALYDRIQFTRDSLATEIKRNDQTDKEQTETDKAFNRRIMNVEKVLVVDPNGGTSKRLDGFASRDAFLEARVAELEREMRGKDGKGGVKSKVNEFHSRLDKLDGGKKK